MAAMELDFSLWFGFGALSLAMLAPWLVPQRDGLARARLWLSHLLLTAALACGFVFGFLEPVALVFVVLAGWSCWTMRGRPKKAARWIAALIFVAMAAAFFLHLAPGFHNPKVIDGLRLAPDSLPYVKYLNYDKPLIGFFFVVWVTQAADAASWRGVLKSVAIALPLILAVLFPVSLASGFVRFDPKWPDMLPFWIGANLLGTCLAEEAFFRGFLQGKIAEWLGNGTAVRTGAWIGAALLFGAAHLPGGWTYGALATLAGLGYGYAYRQSGRLEAPIMVHFFVNLTHLLFFSYPALETAPFPGSG